MVDVVFIDEKFSSERRDNKTISGFMMQQARVNGVDRFLRGGHLSGGSGAVSACPVAHIRGENKNTYIERQGADDDQDRHYGCQFNSGYTF
jgi:hypothetical protein